jgi:aspartate kinase
MTTAPMNILVRKYGGSSLADLGRLQRVAGSIAALPRYTRTVVVVSAQGDTTDRMLGDAARLGASRPTRETDQLLATGEAASAALLAIALTGCGLPAVSLTGAQAGITAAGPPGEGRIADIATTRIRRLLADGNVVVIAGFQGAGQDGDVLTLSRGGSDTTAVALAAALQAQRCEIYTDVDSVYSADPRIVPTARRLPTVDIEVMVEMAFAGAKILHSRAVELAAARDIEVHVRSSLQDNQGTVVRRGRDIAMLEDLGVVAVAHDLDVCRVLVRCDRGHRDPAVDVLGVFARQHAPVDLVARSGPYEDEFRMGLTMRRSDVPRVAAELTDVVSAAGGNVLLDEDVAKVSLVGTGLLNRPQYTARMLSAFAAAGIATSWVSTSQLRTSVTVPAGRALDAVALLHEEFDLDRRPADAGAMASA